MSHTFKYIYLDEDGYPTEDYLEWLKKYNPYKEGGWSNLFETFEDAFKWYDRQIAFKRKYDNKRTIWIHTGGWSGNESIIYALKRNLYFWMHWKESRSGGHYKFVIPIDDKYKFNTKTKTEDNG